MEVYVVLCQSVSMKEEAHAMKGVAIVIITSIVTVQMPEACIFYVFKFYVFLSVSLFSKQYTDKLAFNSVWY